VLHYQPQVDLATGKVCALEALLRWQHPIRGLLAPIEFLPLAEEAGLMAPVTALVLSQALKMCAEWRASGHEVAVSVNVSATNLLDRTFVGLVRDLLARNGLPPAALILEITEHTVLEDFEACRLAVAEARELGVDVSIDDFGAGFTSLAYLGNLAVRELKLDRTFITNLGDVGQDRDFALIRATIELGHALGLRVVAEGIEDSATFDLLADAGCDLAQGYYISRPVPPQQLTFRAETHAAARPLEGLRAS
jgi:EAL domain-containing protein (putative c-di-GMP-specific phosphodiesterase class I)